MYLFKIKDTGLCYVQYDLVFECEDDFKVIRAKNIIKNGVLLGSDYTDIMGTLGVSISGTSIVDREIQLSVSYPVTGKAYNIMVTQESARMQIA